MRSDNDAVLVRECRSIKFPKIVEGTVEDIEKQIEEDRKKEDFSHVWISKVIYLLKFALIITPLMERLGKLIISKLNKRLDDNGIVTYSISEVINKINRLKESVNKIGALLIEAETHDKEAIRLRKSGQIEESNAQIGVRDKHFEEVLQFWDKIKDDLTLLVRLRENIRGRIDFIKNREQEERNGLKLARKETLTAEQIVEIVTKVTDESQIREAIVGKGIRHRGRVIGRIENNKFVPEKITGFRFENSVGFITLPGIGDVKVDEKTLNEAFNRLLEEAEAFKRGYPIKDLVDFINHSIENNEINELQSLRGILIEGKAKIMMVVLHKGQVYLRLSCIPPHMWVPATEFDLHLAINSGLDWKKAYAMYQKILKLMKHTPWGIKTYQQLVYTRLDQGQKDSLMDGSFGEIMFTKPEIDVIDKAHINRWPVS